jgi:hypothetical protein
VLDGATAPAIRQLFSLSDSLYSAVALEDLEATKALHSFSARIRPCSRCVDNLRQGARY